MNFVEAVLTLRAGLDPLTDFVVVDRCDGNGPFLAAWNHSSLRPSDEEIAAVLAAQGN